MSPSQGRAAIVTVEHGLGRAAALVEKLHARQAAEAMRDAARRARQAEEGEGFAGETA